MLLNALDLLEREVSSSTGLPRWLTTTTNPDLDFQVETIEDAAEAALEEWDEKNSGKKKKRGIIRYAVPVSVGEHSIEGGLARERALRLAEELAAGASDDDPSAGLDIDRKMPKGGWNPADYG